MKKTRKLMCLLLVAVLTGSMVVPAMAVSEGSGSYNGYNYDWSVRVEASYSIAQINASSRPTYVKAYVENKLVDEVHNLSGTTHSLLNPASSYVTASVTADNIIVHEGLEYPSTIVETFAKFWVGEKVVVPGVYAYME